MASESPPPNPDDLNPPPPPPGVAGPATEAPTKSNFVNSEPIREDQVQNAIKFLSHPRVKGSPVVHRRNFLERKGLTREEIDEAFRRVPDSSSDVTSAQTTTTQDGQLRPSSNIQQQGSAQTIQPAGGAPSGVVSTFRRQFHWYHAFLAVGFLAASGAGTVIIFKKSIIPSLRSWIRKVVSNEDDEGLDKNDLKPSLNEEAVTAAKAAAAAAADAAKASQEMVILKSEEKQRFEQFMSVLDGQLQEIKSMKTAIVKLEEGQIYNLGRGHQVNEEHLNGSTTHLRQPLTNGRADYDSRSARSPSYPFSSEPLPPNPNQPISNPRTKPWETVQPARTTNLSPAPFHQSNNESPTPWWQQKNVSITEIENEDDNQGTQSNGGDIPINQPPQRKWVPPQPPPVAIPEAAIAIRQPKPKPRTLDSTSSNGSEIDELQKVTKISEAGGEPEMNGAGLDTASSTEIQEEEQVAS